MATGSMNLDGLNFSDAPGDGASEFSTIADMFLFWRNTFGEQLVCLASDPEGPHLAYEQLSCFSTVQVNEPSSEGAGYLTCDFLDNATAALLGPKVHVVPTAAIKLWMRPTPNARFLWCT